MDSIKQLLVKWEKLLHARKFIHGFRKHFFSNLSFSKWKLIWVKNNKFSAF